jgi:protein SCO1/2
MSKKAWLYGGFFVALLAGFYIVLMSTTDFGNVKLPVLNTIHPFSFTMQDGKTITEKDVQGKVYVAEYFFTTCKGICPKMNKNMKVVYEALKSEPGFLILSHTVDPETDSVPVLRRYADSIGASKDNWWFLTGAKESLYKSARESYLLDDPKNSSKNISDQFIHTQFFALVDHQGRVRGIYDGLKQDEVSQLIDDVHKTLNERKTGQ